MSLTRGSMVSSCRITVSAASSSVRISAAYASWRSASDRSAKVETKFSTPGILFQAGGDALDEQGPLDLAGRRGAGEGGHDRDPAGVLERCQPALAVVPQLGHRRRLGPGPDHDR